jgi:hypothetical protein
VEGVAAAEQFVPQHLATPSVSRFARSTFPALAGKERCGISYGCAVAAFLIVFLQRSQAEF